MGTNNIVLDVQTMPIKKVCSDVLCNQEGFNDAASISGMT